MSEQELRDRIRRLREENERLQRELDRVSIALYGAEFRIEHELEPRIEKEKRAYDQWAASPERAW